VRINTYLLWAIIVAIVFLVIIITIGLFQTPFVNYEGAVNGTNLSYGNVHALQYGTVPTIINGMTAVTSIIIGFSVAIIALVYREHFIRDIRDKSALLILAFYSVIPLTFLVVVYNSLIYGALDFALKWASYALLLSLAEFIFSMLAIYQRLSSQQPQN